MSWKWRDGDSRLGPGGEPACRRRRGIVLAELCPWRFGVVGTAVSGGPRGSHPEQVPRIHPRSRGEPGRRPEGDRSSEFWRRLQLLVDDDDCGEESAQITAYLRLSADVCAGGDARGDTSVPPDSGQFRPTAGAGHAGDLPESEYRFPMGASRRKAEMVLAKRLRRIALCAEGCVEPQARDDALAVAQVERAEVVCRPGGDIHLLLFYPSGSDAVRTRAVPFQAMGEFAATAA